MPPALLLEAGASGSFLSPGVGAVCSLRLVQEVGSCESMIGYWARLWTCRGSDQRGL